MFACARVRSCAVGASLAPLGVFLQIALLPGLAGGGAGHADSSRKARPFRFETISVSGGLHWSLTSWRMYQLGTTKWRGMRKSFIHAFIHAPHTTREDETRAPTHTRGRGRPRGAVTRERCVDRGPTHELRKKTPDIYQCGSM